MADSVAVRVARLLQLLDSRNYSCWIRYRDIMHADIFCQNGGVVIYFSPHAFVSADERFAFEAFRTVFWKFDIIVPYVHRREQVDSL